MRPRPLTFGCIACLLLATRAALADWNNLSGAETAPDVLELTVWDDRVEVALEIALADLEHFADLVPDGWPEAPAARPPLAERLRRFATAGLRLEGVGGAPLEVELRRIERRERKDRQTPYAGSTNPFARTAAAAPTLADTRVVYAELVYRRDGAARELTIVPPLNEEGRARVTIGFIAYHRSVPIIDFRYLSGRERLFLDTLDPWRTRFANSNLTRHHDSPTMSFLSIEPFEVRHEVLLRVADLRSWMDLGLRDESVIAADETAALKRRIGEFVLSKNPVRIDGEALRPVLDRADFVRAQPEGLRIIDDAERLDPVEAIVGVIVAYVTEGMPSEVMVAWELFPDDVERVPATTLDPSGPLPGFVDRDNPLVHWTNRLRDFRLPTVDDVRVDPDRLVFRVPLISLVCLLAIVPAGWLLRRRGRSWRAAAGLAVVLLVGGAACLPVARVAVPRPAALAPVLADEDARFVLDALLRNVYRAFHFRDESAVYDKLAVSVSGELLSEVYLAHRRSFAVEQAGGAQAKVRDVEVLGARVTGAGDAPQSYVVDAQWGAEGTVGHWGHVHARRNVYRAAVTIAPLDGRWTITALDVREEARVESTPAAPPGRRGG